MKAWNVKKCPAGDVKKSRPKKRIGRKESYNLVLRLKIMHAEKSLNGFFCMHYRI